MTETVLQHGHPALTDPITGLPNRLHFDTVYRVVFHAVDRGIPIALAALEVDALARHLAERGPTAVDGLLRRAADLLRDTKRAGDVLARVGDGRFFLLLFDCNAHGARVAVDRLLDRLDAAEDPGFTASAGVAAAARGQPATHAGLVRSAEGALGRALARGPKAIELFSGEIG